LLRTFVKHVPVAVAMFDRDMHYLQVSDRWCSDFFLDASKILGRSHYESLPDIPDRWKEFHRRGLTGETLRAEEDRWEREEGGTTWVRWEIRPWGSSDGLPEGILIFSEDITHRKKAELALHDTQERLTSLVQSAMDAIIAIDTEQRILLFNAAAENIFGCPASDAIGSSIERFIPQKFRAEHCSHIRRFAETGVTNRSMGTLGLLWGLHADGREFPIEASISQTKVGNTKVLTVILRDVTERLLAENGLKKSEEYSRDLVLRSPVAMVVTRGPGHRNELLNHKFTELFGYTIQDVPDETSWWPLAYPDEMYREAIKAEWHRRVERALTQQTDIEPMEATVHCKDGSSRQIEFHFASLGDTSLVSFVDLTDRHRAQVQLRESEERFRLVANSAPVLIWMSGADRQCNYFNQAWLEFTGRPLEAELGTGWAEGVHPGDLKFCLETYTSAFDRRESFTMQYRLRRNDREHRWVFNHGVPRFNPDGSFAGYIGSCIDVSERKMAEDALARLSGQLIEAQEEERKRIARELHDDYNQRLAMIAIDLEKLVEDLGDSSVEASQQLHELFNRVSELGADLHSLSHQLHSSTLENLGLVAGVKAFCEEFAEQQGIQVDFAHENVPRAIPADATLCIFRIAQEALRNVRRHSGANRAEVRVEWIDEMLHLSVSDRGRGFNPNKPSANSGIGIRSMEERLRLLGGQFEIHSRPMEGTKIDACLPFKIASQHAS
jgi:PAS domain S-box-containing protein